MPSKKEWLTVALATHKQSLDRNKKRIVLLDTAQGSENAGDVIIMDACEKVMDDILGSAAPFVSHLPTHYYVKQLENLKGKIPIVCGTNLLYCHMADQAQWVLPHSIRSCRYACLLGVGMNDADLSDGMDLYSSLLLKALLHPHAYQSVRDSTTERILTDAGIHNVLNTACPTMWNLTPQRLAKIPQKKASTVLTSVTDYCADASRDAEMIGILTQEYAHVAIWVQGSHDIDFCLDPIIDTSKFELVGPGIEALNSFLANPDVDYVGTRLHAGIRSLDTGHRTLIVAVDERARAISRDTNLPVIEAAEMHEGGVERWINHPEETELSLPWDKIELWKSQWS